MAETTEMQTATETVPLRAARKRAGLGLERCARSAGVTVRNLVSYEKGRASPGITNAAKIARALKVRVDEIEEFVPAVRETEAAGFALVESRK